MRVHGARLRSCTLGLLASLDLEPLSAVGRLARDVEDSACLAKYMEPKEEAAARRIQAPHTGRVECRECREGVGGVTT